ncbi:hypothetical protein BKA65DRAFT_570863 [Rhexocercosporidium sp. MPI-PUGE-AT-0058]|nr:hypothetical protein BKA65DRAFT_570863 [Rhexocercosporidium sp. MPI-PUGE-AT-0058]
MPSIDVMDAPKLSETPSPRRPCWEILELDHPDHLECYRCKKLHNISDVLAHPKAWIKCRKGDQKLRVATFIHPDFDLTIFRMIMKRHRQGKGPENFMELLAYRGTSVLEDSHVSRFTAEPRIIDGRLLMRSEKTYVVAPADEAAQCYLLKRNLLKCPHTSRWTPENITVTQSLHRRFATIDSMVAGRREHIMSYQCDFCLTEFDVSLQRFEGQGIVLFVVKWQDIGTGLSPLDDDLPPVVAYYDVTRTARKGPKPDYTSPRTRFEGTSSGDEALWALSAALACEQRRELFVLHSSWRAKLCRSKDRLFWPLSRSSQLFPHRHPTGSGIVYDRYGRAHGHGSNSEQERAGQASTRGLD